MSRRAKLGVAVIVVLAQIAAVVAYRHVEAGRSETAAAVHPVTPPVQTDDRIESLWVVDRDGYRTDLGALERATLVHFWATWCAPCLTELPALLAVADRESLPTLAVSVDPSWVVVHQIFPQRHSAIRLAESKDLAARTLDLQTLPVTLLVGPEGRILLRADGARDWTDPAFIAAWQR